MAKPDHNDDMLSAKDATLPHKADAVSGQLSGRSETGSEHSHEHPHGHTHEHGHGASHDSHTDHGEEACGNDTILTVRAASGLSGDIMLGGLATLAGLTEQELHALLAELNVPALEGCLKLEQRMIHHIAGVGCAITLPHEHAHRTLQDILKIIENSAMPDIAREHARSAFVLLAEAEAAVHGKKTEDVTFHEVGALDSILDICMVCRLFVLLQPCHFVCSPLPLADGVIRCAHGDIPSPAPAVLRMLNDVPVRGFPGSGETVTPTAIALLKALGASFGPWPAMTVQKSVISYGTKVFEHTLNGAIWALGRQTA